MAQGPSFEVKNIKNVIHLLSASLSALGIPCNLRSNCKFKLIKINIQSKAAGPNYLLWQREFNLFKKVCKKN